MPNQDMLTYEALLEMARKRPEPQRLLFVFSNIETREGSGELGSESDISIAPVMYKDWPLDELNSFTALVEETRQADFDWHIVFVAGLAGSDGALPSLEETDERLQTMVKSIHQGMIANFAVYDREGNPVKLLRTPHQ